MTTPAAPTRSARSLEADAERERTLDRLEARMKAPQFALRTRQASPHTALWLHDLRETRETWTRLVDPDGQDPTPERS
ncbi:MULTISPECIES: hypothetical protein [unclassified Streptomyces]|uniref:hypothetical protein n=1 Tax=unclassified Streptomyces TaxID=2593676 RepID=UPI00081F5963|nr:MULTISPECIES: hypothetical protein [unclassified Streptomyces]MYR28094.1 hypothetical protein [Streptomyces sp. SID4945]SCF33753.1 hypothetical protein GA0115257_11179 [Streptomyces sp. LcepLS]